MQAHLETLVGLLVCAAHRLPVDEKNYHCIVGDTADILSRHQLYSRTNKDNVFWVEWEVNRYYKTMPAVISADEVFNLKESIKRRDAIILDQQAKLETLTTALAEAENRPAPTVDNQLQDTRELLRFYQDKCKKLEAKLATTTTKPVEAPENTFQADLSKVGKTISVVLPNAPPIPHLVHDTSKVIAKVIDIADTPDGGFIVHHTPIEQPYAHQPQKRGPRGPYQKTREKLGLPARPTAAQIQAAQQANPKVRVRANSQALKPQRPPEETRRELTPAQRSQIQAGMQRRMQPAVYTQQRADDFLSQLHAKRKNQNQR